MQHRVTKCWSRGMRYSKQLNRNKKTITTRQSLEAGTESVFTASPIITQTTSERYFWFPTIPHDFPAVQSHQTLICSLTDKLDWCVNQTEVKENRQKMIKISNKVTLRLICPIFGTSLVQTDPASRWIYRDPPAGGAVCLRANIKAQRGTRFKSFRITSNVTINEGEKTNKNYLSSFKIFKMTSTIGRGFCWTDDHA